MTNGNLINDSDRTYVYDVENRLTSIKDKDGNTIASFTYRADGMRKTMTTGSKTITFHYDEDNNVTHETIRITRLLPATPMPIINQSA